MFLASFFDFRQECLPCLFVQVGHPALLSSVSEGKVDAFGCPSCFLIGHCLQSWRGCAFIQSIFCLLRGCLDCWWIGDDRQYMWLYDGGVELVSLIFDWPRPVQGKVIQFVCSGVVVREEIRHRILVQHVQSIFTCAVLAISVAFLR